MNTKTMPADRELQQLRVLGAWWRLGSSALEPRLLVDAAPLDELGPVEAELAAHGGVDVTIP
jgi:hypothetical protein